LLRSGEGLLGVDHSAVGATDNAVGAATALEVIRILQSLKLKPRRTVRIGLWSAEEQGTPRRHGTPPAVWGYQFLMHAALPTRYLSPVLLFR
jgi:Zn-dependent M28 family amino/carboxypeptidase